MRGFTAFFKKEFKEQLRTYRLLIVVVVFFFFAATTPVLLKFMPEFLKLAGEGMEINFPPPTAVQSLTEYSATIVQFGVLLTVIFGMGAIAREREQGTAAMVLSKPVSWSAWVLAKLSVLSLSFIIALVIASIAGYAYTAILIGDADILAFINLNLLLVLFIVFCLAVTLLFSSLFRSQLAAGGIAFGVLIGQAIFSQIPWIGDYMPGKLTTWGSEIIAGGSHTYWASLVISLVIIVFCSYMSVYSLKRQEI